MEKEKEKLDLHSAFDLIREHNSDHSITSQWSDPEPLRCVIVFKNESWPNREKDYSLESRSYEFRSDEKYFIPEMGGSSIFADSLDGSDKGVRLDHYLGKWKVDYCYIKR